MTDVLLVAAFLLLAGGPMVVLAADNPPVGTLVFSAGVVLLGVTTLVESEDRAVGVVLIVAGLLAAGLLPLLLVVHGG